MRHRERTRDEFLKHIKDCDSVQSILDGTDIATPTQEDEDEVLSGSSDANWEDATLV
jgi:hypothetical protein